MQKPLLPGPELIRLQSYTLDEVKRYVQELNVTDAEKFYSLVRVVWDNLYVGDYWEMDEEFILFLGSMYLSLLTIKHMESL